MPTFPTPEAPEEAVHSASARPNNASWALLALFLAIVVGVPLIQLVHELARREKPRVLRVFQEMPTATRLRAFERELESGSIIEQMVRPMVQFAHFAWLGEGGEKAVIGLDGWLFYRPGIDVAIGTPRHGTMAGLTTDPLPAIQAFREDLARLGIELLIVIAPNKESVYPDRLTTRVGGTGGAPSLAASELLSRLEVAQVPVVNLFRLFASARAAASTNSEALYLVEDSHWSPAGVRLAAQAVAARIRESGRVSAGNVVYQQRPIEVRRVGDILRMLQVPALERRTGAETIICEQVLNSGTSALYQDDPNGQVLVLGDSFLRVFQNDDPGGAGFVAHLARELGQPLASIVSDGGASTLVRQELFRRSHLLKGKKVVVWEFVERDIRLGAEGWQVIRFPDKVASSDRLRSGSQASTRL